MDTLKLENSNVKFIAHRGLSGLERENTCPAFVAAGQRTYFGVETDVRISRDSKFVLLHDSSPDRVSGGRYKKPIEKCTLKQISEIVLPDFDGSFIRRDIRIPTLAEYVSVCKKYNKKCVLEIKTLFSQTQLQKMLDEIEQLGYLDSVIFISFVLDNCRLLRKMTSNKIQYLVKSVDKKVLEICIQNTFDIDCLHSSMTKEWVDRFHQNGLEVNVWTVDTPEDAKRYCDMGVDYITTNILE